MLTVKAELTPIGEKKLKKLSNQVALHEEEKTYLTLLRYIKNKCCVPKTIDPYLAMQVGKETRWFNLQGVITEVT